MDSQNIQKEIETFRAATQCVAIDMILPLVYGRFSLSFHVSLFLSHSVCLSLAWSVVHFIAAHHIQPFNNKHFCS